jgi:hypothetical protein
LRHYLPSRLVEPITRRSTPEHQHGIHHKLPSQHQRISPDSLVPTEIVEAHESLECSAVDGNLPGDSMCVCMGCGTGSGSSERHRQLNHRNTRQSSLMKIPTATIPRFRESISIVILEPLRVEKPLVQLVYLLSQAWSASARRRSTSGQLFRNVQTKLPASSTPQPSHSRHTKGKTRLLWCMLLCMVEGGASSSGPPW